MKRSHVAAAYVAMMVVMVAMAGCAALQIPVAKTFNQRTVAAYTSVDTVVQTTTVLVNRDVISANDAQNVRNTATDVRRGIEVAEQLYAIRPSAGEDKLIITLRILSELEKYLAKVQK